MAGSGIKKYYKDIQNLFKGGPVVRHRVANKIKAPGDFGSPVGTARAFLKNTNAAYASTMASYGQYNRLARYCLSGDTLIPVTSAENTVSIKDLTDRMEKGEEFHTFSYDKEAKSVVTVPIKKAWKTKKDELWEVHIDNGTILRCTKDHPIMLRDGSYKEAQYLNSGDALMPFHRKEFKYDNKGNYQWVYSFHRKWVTEHRLVAEMKYGRSIDKNIEEIHHKNFIRQDNTPENLVAMDRSEHKSLHMRINNKRFEDSKEREKQSVIARNRWAPGGDLRENLDKNTTSRLASEGWKKQVERLKEYNRTEKPGQGNKGRTDQKNFDNANADKEFSFQSVCNAYREGMSLATLASTLDCSIGKVRNRLKWEGYSNYTEFKTTYKNHKVVGVHATGKVEDVYDLTIDKYHNFPVCDSRDAKCMIFLHNSDYNEMECLHASTLVYTIEHGWKEISELSEMYPTVDDTFRVYSYDHENKKVVIDEAFHVRPTKVDVTYKISFADDAFVIANGSHPFMLDTGEYTQVKDLKVGDAPMTILNRKKIDEVQTELPIIQSSDNKVSSIEKYDESQVYDLSTRVHHNFAVRGALNWRFVNSSDEWLKGSVFVHNSMAEIGSALDIYADEACSPGEDNQIIKIDSGNKKIREALQSLFYDVLNLEFEAWSWIRNAPVSHDTPIPLLSGETIPISEVSERVKSGGDVWVYSVQDSTNKLVPGKVTWCDKNYTAEKMAYVTLDDGSLVKTAVEHPFVMRDGTHKRADELTSGESLMPFYRRASSEKHSMKGYEMVYDPSAGQKYKYTHRMVAYDFHSYVNERRDDKVIHHKNVIKRDNNPRNLEVIDYRDHLKIHQDHAIKVLHSPEVTKKRLAGIQRYLRSDERKARLSKEMSGIYPGYFKEYNNSELRKEHDRTIRKDSCSNQWKDLEFRNKVISANSLNLDDECLDFIVSLVRKNNRFLSLKEVTGFLSKDVGFLSRFEKINPKFYKGKRSVHKTFSHTGTLNSLVKKKTNKNYYEFLSDEISWIKEDKKYQKYSSKNHKVLSVEIKDETADVYCMTVTGPRGTRDRHNFAVCGVDESGVPDLDSGVFVANCKYGDQFLLVDHHPDYGVLGAFPLPVNEIEREEGFDEDNPLAFRYRWITQGNKVLENWQIIHFRINSNDNFLPYGSSILEVARRVWRQLILMEDAVMVYRIVRSPERRVFKIDVGNIAPADVPLFMEKAKTQLKRNQVVDTNSGRVDLRYNPLSTDEDYFIPVRGEHSSDISSLPGGQFPVRKDSIIPLLDGRKITIEELAKEFEEGKENWVYSIQDESRNFVPGKVAWCGKNYTCTDIHRIWLDDGSYVDMAPEHPVVMRDGSSKKASDLQPGESLMPFNTKLSDSKEKGIRVDGYEMICDPSEWDLFSKDYLSFTPRNQKVQRVEVLTEVDDVYCMTVLGPNNEHDRHNFAMISQGIEHKNNIFSGIFVKNTGDIDDLKYIQNKLFAALKIPKSYLGYEDGGGGKCLHPDTMIPVLNGDVLSIVEISDRIEKGEAVWVYTIDEKTKNIVPGKVSWGGLTRKNAKLVQVTLDNGESIKCTPDHKFMLRSGEYREAQNLRSNDSLMPWYTKISSKSDGDGILDGYEKVYDPNKDKYVYTHQMAVCRERKKFDGKVIHHADFNKRNNNPENLDCSMTFMEHRKFHQKHIKKTMNSPEAILRRTTDPAWLKSVSEAGKKGCKALARWRLTDPEIIPWNKGLTKENDPRLMAVSLKFQEVLEVVKCLKGSCENTFRKTRKTNTSTGFRKFCSHSCANSVSMKNKRQREHHLYWKTKSCKTCNSDFETRIKKDSKFCSVFCRRQYPEYKTKNHIVTNHKVFSVEHIEERVDCYDLSISGASPNFAVSAGIYLHNSTLSQQDVRFSRTIQRIQRVFMAELNKIAIIHLWSMGFKHDDLVNFDLSMANPSTISELQRLELLRTKFEVSAMVPQTGLFDKQFVYENIWKLPPEEVESIIEGRRKDRLVDAEIEQLQPPQPVGMTPPMGGPPGMPPPPPMGGGMGLPPPPPMGGPPGMPPPPMGGPPGLPPPPQPLMAGRDPNKQTVAPNDMLKTPTQASKHKKISGFEDMKPPDLKNYAFNIDKTALDFKRTKSEMERGILAPFGESSEKSEEEMVEEAFRRKHAFVRKIEQDLQEVEVLRQARERKTKKVMSD